MQQLLIATKNEGKQKELEALIAPLNVVVKTLADVDHQVPDVVEDGETFAQNALKKAEHYYRLTGIPTLADDSGLEVQALNGEPGVYSARYAGAEKNDQANNEKLLHRLQNVPWERRAAHFTCVMAYTDDHPVPLIVGGRCYGTIALAPRGEHGFGYDPLFYIPEYEKTMAELSSETKNAISHRYHALQSFKHVYEQTRL